MSLCRKQYPIPSIVNTLLGNKEQFSMSEVEGAAIPFSPKGFWLWHLRFCLLLFLLFLSLLLSLRIELGFFLPTVIDLSKFTLHMSPLHSYFPFDFSLFVLKILFVQNCSFCFFCTLPVLDGKPFVVFIFADYGWCLFQYSQPTQIGFDAVIFLCD